MLIIAGYTSPSKPVGYVPPYDFKNQTVILQIMDQLARQGMAVVMASHYPDHALLFSSRVALMKEGGFLDMGKPKEVMTDGTLGEVYGMEVSLVSVKGPHTGLDLTLCVPRLDGGVNLQEKSNG